MSSFTGAFRVIGERGLFCSLYADRAQPLLASLPCRLQAARWIKDSYPTQRWGARFTSCALGIESDPERYSLSEARWKSTSPSASMFGTLQKTILPPGKDSGSPASPMIDRRRQPNLKEVYLPQHNARLRAPGRGRRLGLRLLRRRRSTISSASRRSAADLERQHRALQATGWSCSSPPTAIAATTSRPRSGCTSIPTARLAVFHGPRCLARYKDPAASLHRHLNPAWPRDPSSTRQRRKALWTSGLARSVRLTTSPQAATTTTEAAFNSYGT